MDEVEAVEALRTAARTFATVMPDVAKGKGRAYEAWVMLALANRLVTQGYKVAAVDSAGKAVRKLRLRKNPSPMASAATSKTSPCHLVIWQHPYGKFELHLGMQHLGASGALHEIDLSIVPHERASALRANGEGPWSGPTCFIFELKAYKLDTKLDLGIGRSMVGVSHDLNPFSGEFKVQVTHRGRTVGWSNFCNVQPRLYLVTTAGLYPDTTKLLEWYGGVAYPGVVPKKNEHPLDDLLEDMTSRYWCDW